MDLPRPVIPNVGKLVERRLIGAVKRRPKRRRGVDTLAAVRTRRRDDAGQRIEWAFPIMMCNPRRASPWRAGKRLSTGTAHVLTSADTTSCF